MRDDMKDKRVSEESIDYLMREHTWSPANALANCELKAYFPAD